MPAVSYPPLLAEGFQEIKLWQLDALFLEPFAGQEAAAERRKYLIDRFRLWLDEFAALGLSADIWLDGSFTTHKPEPSDMDIVVIVDFAAVDALSDRAKTMFDQLLNERGIVRIRWGCDVYFIDQADKEQLAYWRDTFGRDSRSLQQKGLYHLRVAPPALKPVLLPALPNV